MVNHKEEPKEGKSLRVDPEISVVLPMYNEATVIEKTLSAVTQVLADLDASWEILVVDDGSTDGSADRVADVSQTEDRIRLVSYPLNRGRGYALRQGFARAAGSYIISTESDLSWGPEVVAKIYHTLLHEDADVVVATPYLPGGGLRNVPWHRHFISWAGNKVLCFSLGGVVTMASGMTRGYRREILAALDLEADDKEIHLEILSKILTLGARLAEVPAYLTWEKPTGKGGARRSSFKLRKFVQSHLLFSFEEYPFLLFGSLGGILFLLGLAFGFQALSLSLKGVPVSNRPLTLGSVLLILFGLQIVVFSFLSVQNRNLAKGIVRLTALLKRLEKDDGEETRPAG